MVCFCSAKLGPMVGSVLKLPSLAGLLPPISANLTAAASLGSALAGMSGVSLSASAAASLNVSASAAASLMANLSLMASLSADLKAALGLSLTASATADLKAQLTAAITSLNANGSLLAGLKSQLAALLAELAGLERRRRRDGRRRPAMARQRPGIDAAVERGVEQQSRLGAGSQGGQDEDERREHSGPPRCGASSPSPRPDLRARRQAPYPLRFSSPVRRA